MSAHPLFSPLSSGSIIEALNMGIETGDSCVPCTEKFDLWHAACMLCAPSRPSHLQVHPGSQAIPIMSYYSINETLRIQGCSPLVHSICVHGNSKPSVSLAMQSCFHWTASDWYSSSSQTACCNLQSSCYVTYTQPLTPFSCPHSTPILYTSKSARQQQKYILCQGRSLLSRLVL